ncbi:hypothetical protein Godav_025496 [Gossypium davidsonii]|nr:hypothetical protein [Gossypium davidsonii]
MEETVDSGITLLRRVKRFLRSEGQWEIKYVPRECNLIVDQLAMISLSWQTSLQIFKYLLIWWLQLSNKTKLSESLIVVVKL